MSIGYNPKIVTNGLVLCFDAGNRKCRAANTIYFFKDLVPEQQFTRLSLGANVTYTAAYNNQGAVVLTSQANSVPNFAAPAYLNFGANSFTVMVWQATQNSNIGHSAIISSANTINSSPHFWGIESSNGISCFYSRSGTGTLNFPEYTANTFHCYAYTRSNSDMINYFDGVQANTGSSATNPDNLVANNAYIFFGAPSKKDYNDSTNIISQRIGWAGIYNRALSAAEIKQNYDALKNRYSAINTAYTTETYDVIVPASGPYMNVSTVGATFKTDGDYKVATFNDSGSFTVNSLGTDPTYGSVVDYLVVAGGGGGGGIALGGLLTRGGGGGAGGMRTGFSQSVTAQTYTITIGGGGPSNTNGSNSSFGSISVAAGGGNGSNQDDAIDAGSGGSGGGGGASQIFGDTSAGGNGLIGQGNNGGNGDWGDGPAAGGGGGAGQAGSNGATVGELPTGGKGGDGATSTITGDSITYAGGGGGAGAVGGSGGSGGGGAGGSGAGTNGTDNLGGGGGGATQANAAGTGGKGVVIIRWRFQ